VEVCVEDYNFSVDFMILVKTGDRTIKTVGKLAFDMFDDTATEIA
jgi:hypothetical protein